MKFYVVAILVMLMMFSHRTSATPVKEAEDLIIGIIKGTFEKEYEDLENCIKDGEEILIHFEKAINFFRQKGIHNLLKGFEEIANAIKLIPQEVSECEGVYDIVKDLEKIAEEFSNPEALIIDIAEHIFWHGTEITYHIFSAVTNFEKDDFFHAGEDIGIIIHDVILGKPKDKIEDVVDFLEGFFKGALENDSVDLEECIQDTDEIIKTIEVIIEDVKGGVSNFEKLIMDVLDLMAEIPKTVVKCEISTAELEILANWTVSMRNASEMGRRTFYAFLKFAPRIKQNFKDMIDGFHTGNFSSSGFGLGDLLHVLFVDVDKMPADNVFDDAVKFLEGFYAKAFNIKLDLDTCEADVDKTWEDVKNAILLMEKFTLEDIKNGLVLLYKAMPELVTAFQVCEAAWPDIEKGFEKLKIFRDHAAYIPIAVTKAITLHPVRTTQDAWAAYKAFTAVPADYKAGGEASGDMLELIVEEMGQEKPVVQALLKN